MAARNSDLLRLWEWSLGARIGSRINDLISDRGTERGEFMTEKNRIMVNGRIPCDYEGKEAICGANGGGCKKTIGWAKVVASGTWLPFDLDTLTSHYGTCKSAKAWRKK